MATMAAFTFTGYPLCITGGTADNAIALSKQHKNSVVFHVEIDSGNTLTGFNAFCYSDISGTITQYTKTAM
jgi:hypothetical protein